MKRRTAVLAAALAAAVLICAAFLLWQRAHAQSAVTAAVYQYGELVEESDPDFEPWFQPILEPASGEVESMLFALQAAIGAGVVGFVLGRITKKPAGNEKETN